MKGFLASTTARIALGVIGIFILVALLAVVDAKKAFIAPPRARAGPAMHG